VKRQEAEFILSMKVCDSWKLSKSKPYKLVGTKFSFFTMTGMRKIVFLAKCKIPRKIKIEEVKLFLGPSIVRMLCLCTLKFLQNRTATSTLASD
jgi:hypothetical protein